MSWTNRLLAVGSMRGALGTYLPATVLQKIIIFARVLVFWHLLGETQYGLWGVGVMIFGFAAPLMTLGANMGIVRYVSHFEARGRLKALFVRVLIGVPAIGIVTTAAAMLASEPITRTFIVSREATSGLEFSQLHLLCVAALANALLLGLYHNMLGFMLGLRAYRLVSVTELAFAMFFLAAGAGMAAALGSGLGLLLAHAAALAACLAGGVGLLWLAVRRISAAGPPEPLREAAASEAFTPATGDDQLDVRMGSSEPRGAARHVLPFALISLVAYLVDSGARYVSYFMTHQAYGPDVSGKYQGFLKLSQPMMLIASASWAVIFSFVARRWEAGRREKALETLETAFKAVAMVTMTMTVVVLVSRPLWVYVAPSAARGMADVVGGQLLLYQSLTSLALMAMIAKLRERPAVIALVGLAALALNVLLARWWMGLAGPVGASWAGGVGMYVGGGAVAAAYMLATRTRVQFSTWAIMASPGLLLLEVGLPAWTVLVVWAGVCAAAVWTNLLFTHAQKRQIVGGIKSVRDRARQVFGWA